MTEVAELASRIGQIMAEGYKNGSLTVDQHKEIERLQKLCPHNTDRERFIGDGGTCENCHATMMS